MVDLDVNLATIYYPEESDFQATTEALKAAIESLGYGATPAHSNSQELQAEGVKCKGRVRKIREAINVVDPTAQITAELPSQRITFESVL